MAGFATVSPPTDLEGAKGLLRMSAPRIAELCEKGKLTYACCFYGVVGVAMNRHPHADLRQGESGIEVLFWPQVHTTVPAVLNLIAAFEPGDPETDHRAQAP